MTAALILLGFGLGLLAAGLWTVWMSRPAPVHLEDQLAAWADGLDRGLARVRQDQWRRSPAPWARGGCGG